MVAPSASTGQEVKLNLHSNIPCAFQWVRSASASSQTIGEKSKEINSGRAEAWIPFVAMPSFCIATSAASAYVMYDEYSGGPGFPWYIPVVMLWGVYMAVVTLAMWHMTLFLPEAPYAAREALRHVGLDKIGIALTLTSGLALIFDLTCMLWSCLAGILIAAVLAFWIILVRMYGSSESMVGLAKALALSSLMTAVMVAWFIHFVVATT